jgi:hypothetical protein
VASSGFVQTTSTGASTGSLAGGIYRLSVDSTKVTVNGVAMAASPAPFMFHRLFGDRNGDATVNPLDYIGSRNAFGKNDSEAGYDAAFDFNADDAVNPLDYSEFRKRFGKAFTY